jgi:FliI/YscN family ATPase
MNGHAASFPLSHVHSDGWVRSGWVTECTSQSLTVRMRGVCAGSLIEVCTQPHHVFAEVREVRGNDALCTPLEDVAEITVGVRALSKRAVLGAYCGAQMLGQCVDAWGRTPTGPRSQVCAPELKTLSLDERCPVFTPLQTGITAIDALCTLGVGQRVGIFSGAGVGKSTLLRRIAERAKLDSHVIALIGERGREAMETVAALRSSDIWKRATVVCATADTSPRERFAAARTAIAQAEWLARRGDNVLLTVDSLTRVANAWRELALASGESPVHRGHPASMVGVLARLVERAGARTSGSITAIYAVLVDGDDPYEPVSDSLRALLDGHIVLSRKLADGGRFPPIDVLRSSSRLMHQLVSPGHLRAAMLIRQALSTLERAEDLFAIGAYKPGGDPALDAAVAQRDRLDAWIFHHQPRVDDPLDELFDLAEALER